MAKKPQLIPLMILSVPLALLIGSFLGVEDAHAQSEQYLPKKQSISFYYLKGFEELIKKQASTQTITARIHKDTDYPRHTSITSGYFLSELLSRFEQLPLEADPAFRIWIQENEAWLPSLFMLELGRLEFQQSPSEGLKWFSLGQFRFAYDAKRCTDSRAFETPIAKLLRRYKSLIKYAAEHKQEYMEAQKAAYQWDIDHPYNASPIWVCAHSLKAIDFHRNDPRPVSISQLLQPETSWPDILTSLRREISLYLLNNSKPKTSRISSGKWQEKGDMFKKANQAIFTVVFLFVFFFSAAYSRDKAWEEDFKAGKNKVEAGQYEQALPDFMKSLEIAEETLDLDAASSSLNNIGGVYMELGRFKEAESYFLRALVVDEKLYGSGHLGTAGTMGNLGALYGKLGRDEEALEWSGKTLALLEKHARPDAPVLATVMSNHASNYRSLKRFAEAEKLYKQALAIREKKGLEKDVALTLTELGSMYNESKAYAQAEPVLLRALEIRKRVLEPNHPDISYSTHALGSLYRYLKQYDKAELYLTEAINSRKKLLGADHPGVATSVNMLAMVYSDKGEYDKAEALIQEAITILEKSVESDDPELLLYKQNLINNRQHAEAAKNPPVVDREDTPWDDGIRAAYKLELAGKYTESLAAYEKTKALAEQSGNQKHLAESANRIGGIHLILGHYNETEKYYQQAIAISKAAFGETIDTVKFMNNLTAPYFYQGRYAEALKVHQETIPLMEKLIGADNILIARPRLSMGQLYERFKNYSEAEKNFKRGIEIFEKQPNPEKSAHAYAVACLGRFYLNQKKFAQAEPLLRRSLSLRESLGAEHPDVGYALMDLASFYMDQNKFKQAEPLVRRSLQIRKKAYGSEHPTVASTLNTLAGLTDDLNQAEQYTLEAIRIYQKSVAPNHPNLKQMQQNLADIRRDKKAAGLR